MPRYKPLVIVSKLTGALFGMAAWSLLLGSASASADPGDAALTVDQALAAAFAHNPELAAAQWERGIAEGDRQQAGLRPNPELSWEAEDTRRNSRTTTLTLSQPLELGGKRGARIEVASRAQEIAAIEWEQQRNALRAEVLLAFYSASTAQQRVALARQSLALAERGLQVADGQIRAGKSSPVEGTRAQVQHAQVRLELQRAERDAANAYLQLATVTGSARPGFNRVQESAGSLPTVPSEASLLQRIDDTAELRLAVLRIDQREASLGLEKAQRIPDLTLSLGSQYSELERERVNVVGVSMPLPLFNRNQGNVLAAARRADQARDQRNATALRVRSEVQNALQQWQTAEAEVSAFQQRILPAAQSAVDTATRGFEMGKFNFLDVLDAQRTLIGARGQYLQAIADNTEAWVRIERIFGDLGPPGRLP